MIEQSTKPIAVSQQTASKLLDIDRRKIAHAIKSRELLTYQLGASVRLLVSDLEAWVRTWPQPRRRKPRAPKDGNNAA
ncbi:excisionase family DNA binding protein [Bradyrhizobium sp. LB14.3]|uniref:hypothetical protein n=1 Tax=Bradyrhizobium sp. LB14.3 TaxID=3156328 RepID=UPI003396CB0E